MTTKTLINGDWSETVSYSDRGLNYGDGLFETIAVRHGKPVQWEQHWRRLQQSCERMRFPVLDEAQWLADIAQLCAGQDTGVIKLIVTRGPAMRGYRLPEPVNLTRIVSFSVMPDYPESYWQQGVKLHLCEMRLGRNAHLAGMKHLNRLEHVLARAEWSDDNIVEGLLLDSEGYVIEGVISNIFWVKDQQLFTPDLSQCGVVGVMRETVIQLAQEMDISLNCGQYILRDLYAADEVFLTNSLVGIWPVRALGGSRFDTSEQAMPVTRKLQQEIQRRFFV
ncbi:MAG: aminodeoxychorismate lyase [Gammaproteobacteria bacterium]|nr:aminodeoxychorismate lyase [Gammaproteobacteria bacterium]